MRMLCTRKSALESTSTRARQPSRPQPRSAIAEARPSRRGKGEAPRHPGVPTSWRTYQCKRGRPVPPNLLQVPEKKQGPKSTQHSDWRAMAVDGGDDGGDQWLSMAAGVGCGQWRRRLRRQRRSIATAKAATKLVSSRLKVQV